MNPFRPIPDLYRQPLISLYFRNDFASVGKWKKSKVNPNSVFFSESFSKPCGRFWGRCQAAFETRMLSW